MKHYSVIDHTADIGIRVQAKTLKSIFSYSAKAVFELSFQKRKKKSGKGRAILVSAQAKDIEELFVNWLNELLSLSQAKGVVFSSFKIKTLNPFSVVAQAIAFCQEDYRPEKEIKAATYHGLKIEEKKDGWTAEVIFDV
jgi:SHS2 domain-containing protein